jgi:urea transport system ATP-binding protein
MLVAQSPDLLLVDEPVAGLTDEETENVGNLLLALAESHSIVVIEHDMEFVRQIARQVTVLHQGSVLCEGNMDQIQNDPRVIEVYLGQETSVTPQQLKMLKIAAAMAWSDGYFAPEEEKVIIDNFSEVFANNEEQQEHLKEELKGYLSIDYSWEDLVMELETEAEKELILRLAYKITKVSNPDNNAYQRLVQILSLSPENMQKIEANI